MLSKYITFNKGNIIKDDFIDINDSLINQKDKLYEDMFLIDYPHLEICLDIGWYNGDIKKGNFIISVIKDENWDEPLIRIKVHSLEDLTVNIDAVLAFITALEGQISSNKH